MQSQCKSNVDSTATFCSEFNECWRLYRSLLEIVIPWFFYNRHRPRLDFRFSSHIIFFLLLMKQH